MKKQFSLGSHVGTASILLIFMVVCLISFATLTMVNSNADSKLTAKLEEKTTSYYEAVHKANAFVASEECNVIENGSFSTNEDTITQIFEINDFQDLYVTLEKGDSGNGISITRWQIVNEDEGDEYDVTLPVLK